MHTRAQRQRHLAAEQQNTRLHDVPAWTLAEKKSSEFNADELLVQTANPHLWRLSVS
jgi:hypothetical protein